MASNPAITAIPDALQACDTLNIKIWRYIEGQRPFLRAFAAQGQRLVERRLERGHLREDADKTKDGKMKEGMEWSDLEVSTLTGSHGTRSTGIVKRMRKKDGSCPGMEGDSSQETTRSKPIQTAKEMAASTSKNAAHLGTVGGKGKRIDAAADGDRQLGDLAMEDILPRHRSDLENRAKPNPRQPLSERQQDHRGETRNSERNENNPKAPTRDKATKKKSDGRSRGHMQAKKSRQDCDGDDEIVVEDEQADEVDGEDSETSSAMRRRERKERRKEKKAIVNPTLLKTKIKAKPETKPSTKSKQPPSPTTSRTSDTSSAAPAPKRRKVEKGKMPSGEERDILVNQRKRNSSVGLAMMSKFAPDTMGKGRMTVRRPLGAILGKGITGKHQPGIYRGCSNDKSKMGVTVSLEQESSADHTTSTTSPANRRKTSRLHTSSVDRPGGPRRSLRLKRGQAESDSESSAQADEQAAQRKARSPKLVTKSRSTRNRQETKDSKSAARDAPRYSPDWSESAANGRNQADDDRYGEHDEAEQENGANCTFEPATAGQPSAVKTRAVREQPREDKAEMRLNTRHDTAILPLTTSQSAAARPPLWPADWTQPDQQEIGNHDDIAQPDVGFLGPVEPEEDLILLTHALRPFKPSHPNHGPAMTAAQCVKRKRKRMLRLVSPQKGESSNVAGSQRQRDDPYHLDHQGYPAHSGSRMPAIESPFLAQAWLDIAENVWRVAQDPRQLDDGQQDVVDDDGAYMTHGMDLPNNDSERYQHLFTSQPYSRYAAGANYEEAGPADYGRSEIDDLPDDHYGCDIVADGQDPVELIPNAEDEQPYSQLCGESIGIQDAAMHEQYPDYDGDNDPMATGDIIDQFGTNVKDLEHIMYGHNNAM